MSAGLFTGDQEVRRTVLKNKTPDLLFSCEGDKRTVIS
jgi:hypothetical protein